MFPHGTIALFRKRKRPVRAEIVLVDHPELGYIDVVPPIHARFKNNPSLKLGNPAPKVGQDTFAILKEHGHSDEEITDMLENKWVFEELANSPFCGRVG